MKKTLTIIILLAIILGFGGALYYLWQKNQSDPVTYKTEQASKRTIVKKTVATGTIVPREEVPIKPNISGIIDKIFIKAGDTVKIGDMIAKLEVVPDITSLNSARNQIKNAKINLNNEEQIFERQKELYENGVISANEYDQAETSYKVAKQNLESAKENFDIIQTGTTAAIGDAATTSVRSTISGMVLDVPVKEGSQVIQANNFNEGTTIATIANVDEMIFEGKVDESEVGKLEVGLPLEITIGAIEDKTFDAILDYIAPKGVDENGAVQFDIEGTLKRDRDIFIRAGLSANASIILEKAEDVVAVEESLIQFDKETQDPYVEVKQDDGTFERTDIELGVSDGIYAEVISGINTEDEIKVWNRAKESENPRRGM
ncbi:efflux RND transporter periplasmic adaptor subunit [Psychroflexus aestuariivivens]|uniref:efflux RND transporter periplasmic adaptor subunit n=1 Tax=Psychroflexus aestuariivivens TaxID=1795040 RepID=UPI000FD76267|nr:efflux RND transporter periplasmic adaptor subunit [Psychroflexus aestuariivivens]